MGQVDDLPKKGRTGTFIFLLLISTALLQANFAQGQLAQPEKITELRSQAERGVAEAQFLLGVLYHDGLVVPQDGCGFHSEHIFRPQLGYRREGGKPNESPISR